LLGCLNVATLVVFYMCPGTGFFSDAVLFFNPNPVAMCHEMFLMFLIGIIVFLLFNQGKNVSIEFLFLFFFLSFPKLTPVTLCC
jgi:hypothetical protein